MSSENDVIIDALVVDALVEEARALAGPFLAGGPGKLMESLLTRLADTLENAQLTMEYDEKYIKRLEARINLLEARINLLGGDE